jgi:hypothetical protein
MIELQTGNEIKPINEISSGSIFVLGEEFKTEHLHNGNDLVMSFESEMLGQPLMKTSMTNDNYLEHRYWCNLAVGLYDGNVYAIPKDAKCKLVTQTIELKTEDY